MHKSSRRGAIAALFTAALMVSAPALAADPLFVGNWKVKASDGTTFPMTLFTAGPRIVGVYDQAGRIGIVTSTSVQPDQMEFTWKQTGSIKIAGEGLFRLDTANTISGTWTSGPISGTWSGTRQ